MSIARVVCIALLATLAAIPAATANAEEREWTLNFDGFFPYKDRMSPLLVYARERDGQWLTAVGSSRDPLKQGNVKKTYNRSWYCGDFSDAAIEDGKMKGRVTMHMTPDLWIPKGSKSYTIVMEVDAKVDDGKLNGDYNVVEINSETERNHGFGRKGKISGQSKPLTPKDLPAECTLRCNMQGALIGGNPDTIGRCMVVDLGLENGKLTSLIFGHMSKNSTVEALAPVAVADGVVEADRDGFTAKVTVPATTLDVVPCEYSYEMTGHFLNNVIVGTYKLTAKAEGQDAVVIDGSFDGGINAGVQHMEVDDRPWYVEIKGFKPPAKGEHPRILFRKSDVPALRKKAATPEGKAMLRRLRLLLDGANGDTMTNNFSPAKKAYDPSLGKNRPWDVPGVYTIGHVAGYGLLYQLTGDKKYADLGRQAFEKAIQGERDRDDRYSFQEPGGALRAGPVIGWYAVGYDLCYDGWDANTREKLGRAIAEYKQGSEGKTYDLEALARGTMPPASNHFGMQVGGAAMALMAIDGEDFVDQDHLDRLFKIVERSLIRNAGEGFGDGGFFDEGDGTGSMASQIAYLTAIQGWKNARGQDFVNSDRPNVRMMSLKWIYQTVVRDGRPVFNPIRGAYGHNVWAREGFSGAGYFGICLGAVNDRDKAAMKWYYEKFLLEPDTERGGPYDTVTRYPHIAACAFVNWPLDVSAQPVDRVLPHCYTDSTCGFYVWRNRWQDNDDLVISTLSNHTKGYMGAKSDRALFLNYKGQRLTWGTVTEGATKHWSPSPMGDTSSLTLESGIAIGVDFTGASGADTMLVTTGKADGQSVKLGGQTLTFYFPTTDKAPSIKVAGDAVTVGKQRVRLVDGNIVFDTKGK